MLIQSVSEWANDVDVLREGSSDAGSIPAASTTKKTKKTKKTPKKLKIFILQNTPKPYKIMAL